MGGTKGLVTATAFRKELGVHFLTIITNLLYTD